MLTCEPSVEAISLDLCCSFSPTEGSERFEQLVSSLLLDQAGALPMSRMKSPDAGERTRRCPVCSADIKPGPFSKSALNPHYRKRHPDYFRWVRRWTRFLLFFVTPGVLVSAMLVLIAFSQYLWYFAGGLAGLSSILLLSFYLRVGSFRKAWQVRYGDGLQTPGQRITR